MLKVLGNNRLRKYGSFGSQNKIRIIKKNFNYTANSLDAGGDKLQEFLMTNEVVGNPCGSYSRIFFTIYVYGHIRLCEAFLSYKI